MWLILGILLPIGFFTAYSVIPTYPTDNPNLLEINPAVGKIIHTAEDDEFLVNYREANNQCQVEITLKQALSVPALVVYNSTAPDSTINDANLLGRLGTIGTYRYAIAPPPTGTSISLLFYDPIRQTIHKELKINAQ